MIELVLALTMSRLLVWRRKEPAACNIEYSRHCDSLFSEVNECNGMEWQFRKLRVHFPSFCPKYGRPRFLKAQ